MLFRSSLLGTELTTVAVSGNFVYAGSRTGELRVSSDSGSSWSTYASGAGPVERIWVSASNPNIAIATLASRSTNTNGAPVHVLHTMNAGAIWDNITATLADVPAHGVSADLASGAIYVANDQGVFVGYTDLFTLGTAPTWTQLNGLPSAAALDAKLDPQGNQLWEIGRAHV